MTTITTARDDILGLFRTAWLASPTSSGYPILYWDVPGEPPSTNDVDGNPNAFARITVRHGGGRQSSLADHAGVRKYERSGLVTVQLFTPVGTGLSVSDALTKITQDAFEGKVTSSHVWFRDTTVNEIGPDGEWFQVNVVTQFIYEEVK